MERLAYSVPETAELLGVSERFVWTLVRSGALPSRKLGRRRLIARVELEQWLTEQPRSTRAANQPKGRP